MDGDFVAVRHLRQSCFDKFYEQIDVSLCRAKYEYWKWDVMRRNSNTNVTMCTELTLNCYIHCKLIFLLQKKF